MVGNYHKNDSQKLLVVLLLQLPKIGLQSKPQNGLKKSKKITVRHQFTVVLILRILHN